MPFHCRASPFGPPLCILRRHGGLDPSRRVRLAGVEATMRPAPRAQARGYARTRLSGARRDSHRPAVRRRASGAVHALCVPALGRERSRPAQRPANFSEMRSPGPPAGLLSRTLRGGADSLLLTEPVTLMPPACDQQGPGRSARSGCATPPPHCCESSSAVESTVVLPVLHSGLGGTPPLLAPLPCLALE